MEEQCGLTVCAVVASGNDDVQVLSSYTSGSTHMLPMCTTCAAMVSGNEVYHNQRIRFYHHTQIHSSMKHMPTMWNVISVMLFLGMMLSYRISKPE